MDIFWKAAHLLYGKNAFCHWLARGMEKISYIIASHAISPGICVGGGSRFEHHGIGCVIHQNAVFGKDCHIYQNVTVGAKWGYGKDGVPRIGDRVQIGAGAVLLGPICIGNDCIIGANAVVIQDVPDGCYALGVPAVIRKRSDVHKDRNFENLCM